MFKALFASLILCLAPMDVAETFYNEFFADLDGKQYILIDKENFTLDMVDKDGYIYESYGMACAKVYGKKMVKGDHKTPEGQFKITQLLYAKNLYHDFGDGKGKIYGAYGPWFLRLGVPGFNDIGIHGTHLPESIGSRATEGCIRLTNENIVKVKEQVEVGTPVVILPDSYPEGLFSQSAPLKVEYDYHICYCGKDRAKAEEVAGELAIKGKKCSLGECTGTSALEASSKAAKIIFIKSDDADRHVATMKTKDLLKKRRPSDIIEK